MAQLQEQRIEWIDSVKGLGIILVFIGHCYIPTVNDFIYSFHIPLFFIISGFIWNHSKYSQMPFRVFVGKKFKAYILPYFKIALICFVVWCVFYGLFRFDNTDAYLTHLWKNIYGTVLVYPRSEYMYAWFPLWFLVSLFLSELMYYLAQKTKITTLLMILTTIVGYILSKTYKLPFCLDSSLSLVIFIHIGSLLRSAWTTIERNKIMVSIAFVGGAF